MIARQKEKSSNVLSFLSINYYEIMKYKKELSVLLIFLTFAWPVFDILDPSYTPTQVILTVIFAYLGMRLTYFVYFKKNL